MRVDGMTKALLVVIGIALWVIALNPWLQPSHVSAQARQPYDFQIPQKVKDEDLARSLDGIERQVLRIETHAAAMETSLSNIEISLRK